MKRVISLIALMVATVVATAQKSQDFASRFMDMCQGDTAVKCVTVSPKMMEQLVKIPDEQRNEQMAQAVAKLRSMRIVNADGEYYSKAEDLLSKNARRFAMQKDYQGDNGQGAFYTRKDKRGDTVELIMLHQDPQGERLTIVDLTGNLDEEFLCFLYNNNKSFKN